MIEQKEEKVRGATPVAPRRLELEVETNTKLHGAWSIALRWQRAETVGTGAGVEVVPRARIKEYGMVENVHDDGLQLEIEPFRNLDVLPDTEVRAPVGQTA